MKCILRFFHKIFYPRNVIKLPIDNEWCDKDHLLLEACFKILVDFVTVECARMYFISFPQQIPMFFWMLTEQQREMYGLEYLTVNLEEQEPKRQEYTNKLISLYMWWLYEREDAQHIPIEIPAVEYMNKEYDLYLNDSSKLKELIDIREIMWT